MLLSRASLMVYPVRQFSQTKNLRKYALNKHMKTVDQGKRLMR